MSIAEAKLHQRPTSLPHRRIPTKFKSVPSSFPFHEFPSSQSSLLSCEFVSRKSVTKKFWARDHPGIRPFAWRGRRDGDERDGILDQEHLVDRFSQFPSNLILGGLEPTINRLSKWLVSGVLGVLIVWRHDAEAVWAVMGSAINVALSITLKRILNEERPVLNQKSDPGMPSSHAQSIFFGIVFVIISIVEGLGINGLTLILSGLTLAIGSYLTWLRVTQQFHTTSQVVVGAALGFGFALAWFWSWNTIVLEEFNSFLWVRVLILLGSAACGLVFLGYVIGNWITDEQ
ncbi:hypothetical protein Nepgr_025869 [Nepenthes gracilis]|uniref:Phosphatidic acid phosphatase type 2/haloperoxidase domain-containing protein n=1 Tax=Nepenthes gracilis TaxID=150966 RepID=A0AAD3T7J7_NEPGR|nr:hypothetical protein Nepgr_025869 [Nepenthes gracilis]